MAKKKLLRLLISISVITVLSMCIPLMSGCTNPSPEVTPTDPTTTPEPTPTPEPEPAAEQPVYKLRFQNITSSAESDLNFGDMVDYIHSASDGRLQIEMYSSCEIVPDDQLLNAVNAGTIDMADYMGILNPELTATGGIENCPPFLAGTVCEWESIHRYGALDIIRRSFEEFGDIHLIACMQSDPVMNLASTKPVETYEDIEGLKIVSLAALCCPFIKAGASVIDLPPDEFFLAGQTGVMDGLIWGGTECYHIMGLEEVFKYYLDESLYGGTSRYIIINSNVWDSLPEDLQTILYLAVRECSISNATRLYVGEALSREHFIVNKFSPEDSAKLRAWAEPCWEEWAGDKPLGQELLQVYKDWRQLVTSVGWRY